MRSVVSIAVLLGIVACAGTSENAGAKSAEDPAAPPEWSRSPEPQRGKLKPTPSSLTLGQFWPTRICTRGPGAIVVSNNCACDSRMTCSVMQRGGTLDLHVGMTNELCKDCGIFSATCAVPRGMGTRKVRIAIDGKPALDGLELPRSDAPPIERCYE
jgi:hypothetical protein